ncbi:serine/threonine-protein kinase/endoribonuclease IRE1b-like protein [Tanacetum coccineum]
MQGLGGWGWGGIMNGCWGDIENYLKNEKLEQVVAIIKSWNALVNISGKILWSIPTGPPIYDAHQSPNLEDDEHNSSRQQNNFYIDCGDDWQLYIYDKNSKAEKLPFSVEELIGKTPHVSEDRVLIGSKNTTVFLVDPKTGYVISTFMSDATLSSEQSSIILKKSAPKRFDLCQLLLLERFDYKLVKYSTINGQIVWYLSISDFKDSRPCPGSTTFLADVKGKSLVHDVGQSY